MTNIKTLVVDMADKTAVEDDMNRVMKDFVAAPNQLRFRCGVLSGLSLAVGVLLEIHETLKERLP